MLPAFARLALSAGYVLVNLLPSPPETAPAVTVQFHNHPPQINHTRSSAYLLHLKKKAVSPDYSGEFPILDGLTNGTFQLKYGLDFINTEQQLFSKACV